MFVKTRQFAIARRRHAASAPLALPHANDNHRAAASHLRRRPLACHWRQAADGRLECRWQIDRVDLSAAADPDLCWRERAERARDNHLPLEGGSRTALAVREGVTAVQQFQRRIRCTAVTPPRTAFAGPTLPLQGRMVARAS